jgi:hypothetical protein
MLAAGINKKGDTRSTIVSIAKNKDTRSLNTDATCRWRRTGFETYYRGVDKIIPREHRQK